MESSCPFCQLLCRTRLLTKGRIKKVEKVTRKTMSRLRQNKREQAIGMLVAGMTQVQVVKNFNVSRMTIARIKTRLRDTGTTNDRPRSGRPRETTLRQDRHILIIHLRNRFVNASQTARQTNGRHNNRISAQTVRNRLRHVGLRVRPPLKGPILTQRHRMARLQWTRVRIRWNRQAWRQVLFTDGFKFNLKFSDGRASVYRRRNERFSDAWCRK